MVFDYNYNPCNYSYFGSPIWDLCNKSFSIFFYYFSLYPNIICPYLGVYQFCVIDILKSQKLSYHDISRAFDGIA